MGFEATLWLAADKLRNNMDAAEYKHVVLGLIFLKYISDSFEEHHAKLAAGEGEYAGANPEDPDEYRAENIFWVPKEARWSYLQANAKQPSIGKIVDDAMVAIERDNPRLKGVLPKDYARPALDKHRLGELIDLIGTIGLGDKENRAKDILGRVYEYFLTQFASAEGKNGGQFYTPSCVVRVLVEMLAPYKGRVYDPCCGSGGMFIQSEKFVEAHGGRIGDISIYGQESKAINNLLRAVEEVAEERSFRFVGAKKYSKEEDRLNGIMISDERDNEAMESDDWQLLAGTVWLFSREAHDRKIDFLFVDEAGQVSLANVIAMGTSARNIVLLGDQMQLGQPIQGVHPGESGKSSLEYLLQDQATIAPDRGLFLGTTWRMHPDVCAFISDAVYDSRLQPEPHNKNQVLVLDRDAHPALKPSGIQFIEARHDACSQSSPEEAEIVRDLVTSLLTQRYRDKNGMEHPIGLENILVVAPYNVQVNLLKRVLPAGSRVGTVDKFQGQEAEVVIVSMTTSSGDYLPRFMDFLYSKNRLNVAVSRARSLAIVVANPELLSIRCRTPEDMALVNTLCWVRDYAARGCE